MMLRRNNHDSLLNLFLRLFPAHKERRERERESEGMVVSSRILSDGRDNK
jgi:hypothetical protein